MNAFRGDIEDRLRPDMRCNADGSAPGPFERLLGTRKWRALAPAIRRRFGKTVRQGESALYAGRVVATRMNLCGWALGQFLRIAGAPLPLDRRNAGVAAAVVITEAPEARGQFWTRQYNRRSGFPQVVQSAKSFSGPTGLEEYVGLGIGMTLVLDAAGDRLRFLSHRYYFEMLGIRLYLPWFLTPGDMEICHRDFGDGRFAFTLDLVHPLLGEMLHQSIEFSDCEQVAPH